MTIQELQETMRRCGTATDFFHAYSWNILNTDTFRTGNFPIDYMLEISAEEYVAFIEGIEELNAAINAMRQLERITF